MIFKFLNKNNEKSDTNEESINIACLLIHAAKIDENFSNINVESIEVLRSANENTIQINITYSVPNTGINDTLELNFR